MLGAVNFDGLFQFVLYLGLGIAMLGVFTRLYIWITPYHEASDIEHGRMAPAIALSGALLGFTFPLLVASFVRSSALGFVAWGALACLVQLLVFWVLYYWLMPRTIAANNVASATVFAAASVCVGLINAASFLP